MGENCGTTIVLRRKYLLDGMRDTRNPALRFKVLKTSLERGKIRRDEAGIELFMKPERENFYLDFHYHLYEFRSLRGDILRGHKSIPTPSNSTHHAQVIHNRAVKRKIAHP